MHVVAFSPGRDEEDRVVHVLGGVLGGSEECWSVIWAHVDVSRCYCRGRTQKARLFACCLFSRVPPNQTRLGCWFHHVTIQTNVTIAAPLWWKGDYVILQVQLNIVKYNTSTTATPKKSIISIVVSLYAPVNALPRPSRQPPSSRRDTVRFGSAQTGRANYPARCTRPHHIGQHDSGDALHRPPCDNEIMQVVVRVQHVHAFIL